MSTKITCVTNNTEFVKDIPDVWYHPWCHEVPSLPLVSTETLPKMHLLLELSFGVFG